MVTTTIERAGRDQPHAMTDGCGEWFYPDNLADAAYFAQHHTAKPAHPGRFADYFAVPRPLGLAAGVVGEAYAARAADGTVTVVDAPRFTRICADLLPPRESWAIRMDGECVVLADQVWYLPVGTEQDGRLIVCELVRDDRT
jgi:hypothetical protein